MFIRRFNIVAIVFVQRIFDTSKQFSLFDKYVNHDCPFFQTVWSAFLKHQVVSFTCLEKSFKHRICCIHVIFQFVQKGCISTANNSPFNRKQRTYFLWYGIILLPVKTIAYNITHISVYWSCFFNDLFLNLISFSGFFNF